MQAISATQQVYTSLYTGTQLTMKLTGRSKIKILDVVSFWATGFLYTLTRCVLCVCTDWQSNEERVFRIIRETAESWSDV